MGISNSCLITKVLFCAADKPCKHLVNDSIYLHHFNLCARASLE